MEGKKKKKVSSTNFKRKRLLPKDNKSLTLANILFIIIFSHIVAHLASRLLWFQSTNSLAVDLKTRTVPFCIWPHHVQERYIKEYSGNQLWQCALNFLRDSCYLKLKGKAKLCIPNAEEILNSLNQSDSSTSASPIQIYNLRNIEGQKRRYQSEFQRSNMPDTYF